MTRQGSGRIVKWCGLLLSGLVVLALVSWIPVLICPLLAFAIVGLATLQAVLHLRDNPQDLNRFVRGLTFRKWTSRLVYGSVLVGWAVIWSDTSGEFMPILLLIPVAAFAALYSLEVGWYQFIMHDALYHLYARGDRLRNADTMRRVSREVGRWRTLHRLFCWLRGVELLHVLDVVCSSDTNTTHDVPDHASERVRP